MHLCAWMFPLRQLGWSFNSLHLSFFLSFFHVFFLNFALWVGQLLTSLEHPKPLIIRGMAFRGWKLSSQLVSMCVLALHFSLCEDTST